MTTDRVREKAWTLVGAARSARDARIAALRYMREAPLERQWLAGILEYGHQVRTAATGDPDAARALQFSTMGYPAPYPQDWNQAGALVLADEARYLAQTDLYVLTPQMLDMVVAAAQTLTFDDLYLLREDDLPSPSGLVIFPRPLLIRTPTGSLERNIAFAWQSPWQIPLPAGTGFRRTELPAARMSGYNSARANQDFAREARSQGLSLPPMMLEGIWSLPLHPSSPDQAHDQDRLATELRRLNEAYRQQESRQQSATGKDQAFGEYASGAVLDEDPDGTLGSRILYAFWRLCEQQIASVDTSVLKHSARVLAARTGVSPDVRVVALRRTRSPGKPAGEAGAHQCAPPLGRAHAQSPAMVPEPAAAQGDIPRPPHQRRHGEATAERRRRPRPRPVDGRRSTYAAAGRCTSALQPFHPVT